MNCFYPNRIKMCFDILGKKRKKCIQYQLFLSSSYVYSFCIFIYIPIVCHCFTLGVTYFTNTMIKNKKRGLIQQRALDERKKLRRYSIPGMRHLRDIGGRTLWRTFTFFSNKSLFFIEKRSSDGKMRVRTHSFFLFF